MLVYDCYVVLNILLSYCCNRNIDMINTIYICIYNNGTVDTHIVMRCHELMAFFIPKEKYGDFDQCRCRHQLLSWAPKTVESVELY